MNDMDRMVDALKDTKFLSSCYSAFATECSTPELRNMFLKLWKDEQDHAKTFSSLIKKIDNGTNTEKK
ncbi:MAG: hypothetical protein CVT98_01505 [Bacteroidetes bacterium HGW-Bacteroidetes-15]|nr:MAG: hypothetical protein CVT98_01505 [Bacteroidetes bacterium HGW-Bacteroidetes-15]